MATKRDEKIGDLIHLAGNLAGEVDHQPDLEFVIESEKNGKIYIQAFEWLDQDGVPEGTYWIWVAHELWGPSCVADDLMLTKEEILKRFPEAKETNVVTLSEEPLRGRDA
jgi:hypothetical protein